MNCVVCAMAKNEHIYINDWVKHYIDIGFSHVYLFDNDDNTSPQIKDYIDKTYLDKVTIFNVRGHKEQAFQKKNYKKFYDEYKNTFDWCLFCDIDEFLFGTDNINDLVSNIPDKYKQIRLKWRLFGDDDLVERDLSIPVYKAFKREVKHHELSNQGKAIIRGGLDSVFFNSVHYGAGDEHETILTSCLMSGKECHSKVEITEDYSSEQVYLNHYMTKTISEFVNQKFNRGDAIFKSRVIDLSYFWNINKKTEPKISWLVAHGLIKKDKPKGIDLVVPYVDSTDPAWQKLFNKYNPIRDKEVEGVNAQNRFRGQGDFFRFFFRGIEKFAPWVGEVYLIVQSESQVPQWINRNQVTVVLHEQFIPKEFLPTFNSTTIEMFLWNIPRLSEKFVYLNDDFFITNNILKSCLFDDVNVVTKVYNVTRIPGMYQHHVDNSYKEIYNKLQDEVITVGHVIRPYFKSDMKECFDLHREAILNSISRFRETKNFNVYLFTFDLMRKGKLINEKRVTTGSASNIIKKPLESPKMMTCIQDLDSDKNIYEDAALFEAFKKRFPLRSKYELQGLLSQEQLDKIESIVGKVPERLRDSFRDKLIQSWSV